MGRLFHTESGRALVAYNEEITRWRWARKVMKLPAAVAKAPADLWLCIYMYEGNREPLVIHVNGRKAGGISPDAVAPGGWIWHRLPLRAGTLRAGVNQIVLRSDNPAMNGWMLSIENGHANPKSAVSFDKGKTWRTDAMGAHSALRGEYVIRIRSHAASLKEATPPAIVYENPKHPRVRELLALIPSEIQSIRDPWKQVLALRTHVSQLWTYRNRGGTYSPWDPATILDWMKRDTGHTLAQPIAMCVHFGAVMTAYATALGHRARCLVITNAINTPWGHFISEVWDAGAKRWVMHDGNLDVHFEDGHPLSIVDLADRALAGQSCSAFARPGPGLSPTPFLRDFYNNWVAPGKCFTHAGVWSQNNYLSDPSAAPPGHGSIAYQETAIVWYNPAGRDVAPMFPYRTANRGYFEKPPGR